MTALAVSDRDLCPSCGLPLKTVDYDQPALLRHGGYGATSRTVYVYCDCGWSLQRERSEIRP